MSGKGSAPRPFNVSNDEYANRWDAIFGKDKCDHKVWKLSDKDPDQPDQTLYECVQCGKVSTSPSEGTHQ